MDCGKCETCKWWKKTEDGYHGRLGIEGWIDEGKCALTYMEDDIANYPETMALVYYYDYFGFLVTKPDFGCVQWAPDGN